jgi:hypothetical protein
MAGVSQAQGVTATHWWEKVGSQIRSITRLGEVTVLTGNGFAGWEITPHLEPLADMEFSIGDYAQRVHNMYIGGNIKSSREVTLVPSVPTKVYGIVLPVGERCSGWFEYGIYVTDGVDYQYLASRVPFAAVNKAGTIFIDLNPNAPDQTNDGNAGIATGGSIAYAIITATTATQAEFYINVVTTLVPTACKADVSIRMLRAQLTDPV